MILRFIFVIFFILFISCSKKEKAYELKPKVDPYLIYQEAYEASRRGLFLCTKKIFRS